MLVKIFDVWIEIAKKCKDSWIEELNTMCKLWTNRALAFQILNRNKIKEVNDQM
jgi:hypothetical protein